MTLRWVPETDPLTLSQLGKLGEETCELGSIAARCTIQGWRECEPVTGKPNLEALEDEVADVLACIKRLEEGPIPLDMARIKRRMEDKLTRFREWESLLLDEDGETRQRP